jgi:hypothetical protein
LPYQPRANPGANTVPSTPFDRQYADLDAAIAAAEDAAARAASEHKAEQGRLNGMLSDNQDSQARSIQRRIRQLEEEIDLAERKVGALRRRREEIAKAEAAVAVEEKAKKVAGWAEERAALAKTAEDAITTLGRCVTDIERLTAAMGALVPVNVTDVRYGVDYSFIAAGINWSLPNAQHARLAGNLLADRIARSNAAALAACKAAA